MLCNLESKMAIVLICMILYKTQPSQLYPLSGHYKHVNRIANIRHKTTAKQTGKSTNDQTYSSSIFLDKSRERWKLETAHK